MANATYLRFDNLSRSAKFCNLVPCDIADYLDKAEFRELVRRRALPKPDVVFHQGACSDTMETDGRYMLDNNYRYSVELLRWCQELGRSVHICVFGFGLRAWPRIFGEPIQRETAQCLRLLESSCSTRRFGVSCRT